MITFELQWQISHYTQNSANNGQKDEFTELTNLFFFLNSLQVFVMSLKSLYPHCLSRARANLFPPNSFIAAVHL